MKSIHTYIIIFLFANLVTGQEAQKDSLSFQKKYGGYDFYVGEQLAYRSTFADRMRQNSEAYYYYRKGNNQNILSNIMSFGASFAIGYTLGTVVFGGNNPNWTPGLIGLGVLVISIPLGVSAERNYTTAVQVYNKYRHNQTSFWEQSEVHLHIGRNGLGVTLNF